ncbi:MAG: 50S ribosomal protein L30 [Anaerolineae bacterium]
MVREKRPSQVRITLVRSGIGYSLTQKRTLKALGLRRLGDSVVMDDRPTLRGMVAAVGHLVRVEEVSS